VREGHPAPASGHEGRASGVRRSPGRVAAASGGWRAWHPSVKRRRSRPRQTLASWLQRVPSAGRWRPGVLLRRSPTRMKRRRRRSQRKRNVPQSARGRTTRIQEGA
jgi:hypothetical protein